MKGFWRGREPLAAGAAVLGRRWRLAGGSGPLSRGVLSGSPEQGWFRGSSGLHVSGGLRGMQVETLAGVVVVVGLVCFSPNTARFGVCFLPPSLPAAPFRVLLAPPRHPLLGPTGSRRPAAPHGLGATGRAGRRTKLGGHLLWGGNSPPQPPAKGFGEESERGKPVVLAALGTEPGALGVGSRQHPHWRQSTAQPAACGAHPPPPPLRPGQPGSRFLIIWSVLDAKMFKK